MLTDKEFAAYARMTEADVAAIGPDAEPFTCFELTIDDKGALPLWRTKLATVTETELNRQDREDALVRKEMRLKRYAELAAAEQPLFEDEDEEDSDEWDKFFDGDYTLGNRASQARCTKHAMGPISED